MRNFKNLIRAMVIIALPALFNAGALANETLKLPKDLQQASKAKTETVVKKGRGVIIEETRTAGRLERVTVHHEASGFTDVYRNRRSDSIWTAPESQLGEGQNVRSWTVGSW